jgi:hypothetical protein
MGKLAEGLKTNIQQIISGSPYNGFANFLIQGRVDKIFLNTYVALYPHLSSSPYSGGIDHKCLAIIDEVNPANHGLQKHLEVVRHDILQLELSQRILDQQEPPNPAITAEVSAGFALVGLMPIAFIGVGETVRGEIEKIAAIWHIRTLTTPAALDMIKSKLQSGLAVSN